MNRVYSAEEFLKIKTSLAYFYAFTATIVIGIAFQFISKMDIFDILPNIIFGVICSILSFYIYLLNKQRKNASILMWISAFTSISIPLIAKLKYAYKFGWTFALLSYNTSTLLVVMVFLNSLFLDKRLMRVIAFSAVSLWTLFVFTAVLKGASYTFDAFINGAGMSYSGVVMPREIFFIVATALISLVSLRFIGIIRSFADNVMSQKVEIENRITQVQDLNFAIKERMESLFSELESQNNLVVRFNEKMQNQAATFEEISATLEELRTSSEYIHQSTLEQIEGNTKLDETIEDFRRIKQETALNLRTSYDRMQRISGSVSKAEEKLANVENTINTITSQSGKISGTVSIITEIAERINLLSLNASIEAARAGEHGRGFAVVAGEIGKLAFSTTESIKEIDKALALNSEVTGRGASVIKDSSSVIKEMINDITGNTGSIQDIQKSLTVEESHLATILQQMGVNINLARAIGTGTEEQKIAIENTSDALEGLNQIVSEMVHEINDLSASSENIYSGARELLEKTEYLA